MVRFSYFTGVLTVETEAESWKFMKFSGGIAPARHEMTIWLRLLLMQMWKDSDPQTKAGGRLNAQFSGSQFH